VEYARVDEHRTEVPAQEQLVDVPQEQVVRVHLDHARVLCEAPGQQLVERVLKPRLDPAAALVRVGDVLPDDDSRAFGVPSERRGE
jgi:hypothetical protein